MEPKKKCVLYVYKGHFGLPSIDYKCLQALFLVQMKLKHKVEVKSSGFYTSPNFPMLEYDGKYYTTQMNILKKLEELIESTGAMDARKKSRIDAYKAFTFQILEKCIVYKIWGVEKNCQHVIKLYASEKYLPQRLIYLRRMNSYVQNVISQYSQGDNYDDGNVCELLESYLRAISHLLTLNKYLMGNSPTTLDAYVCGYLLPLYALNVPDKTLKSIIQRHDIVIKYLINYLTHYHIKLAHEATTNSIQDPEDNERASLGLLATAGFVAFSVMIGYGLINDVFKIK